MSANNRKSAVKQEKLESKSLAHAQDDNNNVPETRGRRGKSFRCTFTWWPLNKRNNSSKTGKDEEKPAAAGKREPPPKANSLMNPSPMFVARAAEVTRKMPKLANSNSKSVPAMSAEQQPPAGAAHFVNSSIALQKLRQTKWFRMAEQRVFCSVVEIGFIVEVRNIAEAEAAAAAAALRSTSCGILDVRQLLARSAAAASNRKGHKHGSNTLVDGDDAAAYINSTDENASPTATWFGVVLGKLGKDNKLKPESIEIQAIKLHEKGTFKMIKMSLAQLWDHGYELRINNFAEKDRVAHSEKDIREQVSFACKNKHSLWQNSKHFAYWCRYGQRQKDVRKRQMKNTRNEGAYGDVYGTELNKYELIYGEY